MRQLLFLSLATTLFAVVPLRAQAPAAKSNGLDLVPTTAFGFVSVRVSDLRENEALKPIREAIAKVEKAEGSLERKFGIGLDEVDRVTAFWPAAPGPDGGAVPVIVVTTRGPFNEAKVLRALKAVPYDAAWLRHRMHQRAGAALREAPPAPKPPPVAIPSRPTKGPPPPKFQQPGQDGAQVKDEPLKRQFDPDRAAEKEAAPAEPAELYLLGDPGAFRTLYRVDDRTLVFFPSVDPEGGGSLYHLVGQLLRRRADGPLADALAEADKHALVAAARVGQMEAVLVGDREFPRELAPFRSLLRARTAALTADLGAKATVTARLTFADAAAARRAEPVLKTLMQAGADGLAEVRKEMAKDAEWANVTQPLLELAATALEKAEVKADGSGVTARVEAEIGPAVVKALAALPDLTEAAGGRMKTSNNLKQIGLAIHNYHDTMGHMPGNVTDSAGRPLFSWRVEILPYIEQHQLYQALDRTKPWNDPRNAKLLEKMPDVFRVFGRDGHEKGLTYFQMPAMAQRPAGPHPILIPGPRLGFAAITDGLSNTIMVVEAAEGVPWAQPGDLGFDPQGAMLPKVGAPGRPRFHALFGDGSVRELRKDRLDNGTFKAMLTVNGGEVAEIPK